MHSTRVYDEFNVRVAISETALHAACVCKRFVEKIYRALPHIRIQAREIEQEIAVVFGTVERNVNIVFLGVRPIGIHIRISEGYLDEIRAAVQQSIDIAHASNDSPMVFGPNRPVEMHRSQVDI